VAAHESGHVTIQVSDDGRGIDLEKVRKKAVERRLMSAEQAEALGEEELIRLIFTPAFSTADKVTNLSGRGFGMDVVRSTLEGVGGTVEVSTRVGQGTTVQLKIPLTLAIIPALIVSSGGERYAIPQVNLLEAVHLKGDDGDRVELIRKTPVYRLRGRLLPLADLGFELGRTGRRDYTNRQEPVNIVVLNVDGGEFGLVVDRISDTQEIVVKPISRLVKGNSCFAGATIMDDGKPALILDVPGLAKRSRVLAAELDEAIFRADTEREQAEGGREAVLLFHLAGYGRMAMSLSKVGRLELFNPTRVEWIGDRSVVQYRDQVMPLVPVGELLGIGNGDVLREPTGELLPVVVCQHKDRWVGLVVSDILDIVEERIRLEPGSRRAGLLGTAVLKGQVTELLDPEELFRQAGITFEFPAVVSTRRTQAGE
jgi:two-component system chemotaxis sensor kinase CheA